MQILDKKNIIDIDKQNMIFKIQIEPFKIEGDLDIMNVTTGYLYFLIDFECFGKIYPFEYQVWCNSSDRLWHKEKEFKWIKLNNEEKNLIEQVDYNLHKEKGIYTLHADNDNFDLRLEIDTIEKTIDYEFFLHLVIPCEYHIKEIFYSETPIKYHEPIFKLVSLLEKSN